MTHMMKTARALGCGITMLIQVALVRKPTYRGTIGCLSCKPYAEELDIRAGPGRTSRRCTPNLIGNKRHAANLTQP